MSKNPYNKEDSSNKDSGKQKQKGTKCGRCGLRGHESEKCNVRCHKCDKIGHIAKKCRQKGVHNVESSRAEDSRAEGEYDMDESCERVLDDELYSEYYDNFRINGKLLCMEFDSGSAVSVVSKRALRVCGLSDLTLTPSRKTLRVANGQIKAVDGCAVVEVELNGEKARDLQLYVAEDFPSLFGRPWIAKFCGQNWLEKLLSTRLVNSVAPDKSQQVSVSCKSCSGSGVQKGVEMQTDGMTVENGWKFKNTCIRIEQCRSVARLKQSEVFKPGLGLVKGVQASFVLKDEAKPVMCKARTIPYALRSKVEQEIDSMVESETLTKVADSPWGTPLVPVMKDGGESVRICGDYKSTLNKCLSTKEYPLPTIEECFNSVRGGQKFSKVDIKKAYNNLLIREEDRVLTTLNTHKGLFQWNRLPYGISSSSAIFQSVMDDTLAGVPMTCCRIDDILISGRNDEEHLINLNNVITRLELRGFKCKVEKSSFMEDHVVYLGHVVSASGIRPVQSKVDSLLKTPEPQNVDQLISFLGAVNYYRRYLPNLSAVIAPLERLRAKNVPWVWSAEEGKAFRVLKKLLSSDRVLTFYDPKLALKLDTDAASGGIGAVLSHIMPNGEERPIEFISRTLSPTERRYAQIDKEALAIVWSIKRLHIYLYMRKFTLVTDHRALVRIFGNKPLPEMTAGRITRWAIFLMNYQYDIQYRNTKEHLNADMLSRLPRQVAHPVVAKNEFADMFTLTLSETLLNAELVANETRKDPILSKVMDYTLNGWPKNLKCEGDLKAFWSRRDELSHELGCLTWGARVVIPVKLRGTVMNILHATHIGVTGMKSLARSYVYWPRLDTQIEDTARTCEACAKHGKILTKIVDHPWAKTSAPFQRVHADFAGPFLGSMWLLLVDSYSKWPEVIQMNTNTTSSATIRAFRSIFARTGIPICLVTDNGPQFVSEETEVYLKSCGIKHVTVPTYSPKSNGICERLVQSWKYAMTKMAETCKDVCKNLNDFLLTYRNTPHSSTKQTPAVLAFNRTLRSKLHQIKPSDRMREQELQSEKLQDVINEHPRTREFRENQLVFVKLDDKSPWIQARVIKKYGENSNNYDIQCGNRIVKKHADVIKACHTPVIQMERSTIPAAQRSLLTRDLARSNVKFQRLEETLERRRLRNLGVSDGQEQQSAEKPSSPVKTASPVKSQGKQVRASPVKTDGKQVYFKDVHPKFPAGGKLTQYLENMKIGDCIDVRGPKGKINYLGNGKYEVKKKGAVNRVLGRKIGMIAGGSGITPMLQVATEILKNPGDDSEIFLLFANQTPEDILCQDIIESMQSDERFNVWYTVDKAPATGWKYDTGFVTADMIANHLPAPGPDSAVMMCGPPPMIKFACLPNLEKLGYTEDNLMVF
ncbi:uncharacterized protein K02A2.6-like [Bolinopsis microptera]|uniref:uncharacterized protein K02A2.6-like n=1 Tax=Bolinopsis microptera TaxID=2820187 RepID=UPI003079AF0E